MRVSKAQLDAERKSKQEDTFKWQEYVHSLKEQLKTALQTAEDDASGWKKLIESKEEELAFAGAQFEFKEQRYVVCITHRRQFVDLPQQSAMDQLPGVRIIPKKMSAIAKSDAEGPPRRPCFCCTSALFLLHHPQNRNRIEEAMHVHLREYEQFHAGRSFWPVYRVGIFGPRTLTVMLLVRADVA